MIALPLEAPSRPVLPPLTRGAVGRTLAAGSVATVAFDFSGQSLSPMLGFANLAPVPLATQVWQTVTGTASAPAGHLLHYVAGLVGYPIGWTLIATPLAALLVPRLHWLAAATAYGVVLWVFAMYVMAHLVAGNPAFLNWTGITWVALAGHVIFALAYAASERALARAAR